jgi:NAD(P)-dependent dehydrogenase (short-subunit alcohol dehydrogenase family)
MRKKPLSEQVVVVLGASSGVGRATAREAGRSGARVVVASRNEEALRNAAAEVEGLGAEALAVPAESTSPEELRRLCEAAVERFGRIDTFVATTMVTVYAEVERLEPEELARVLEVNFLGRAYAFWAALPQLKASRGTFVDVNSALGVADDRRAEAPRRAGQPLADAAWGSRRARPLRRPDARLERVDGAPSPEG